MLKKKYQKVTAMVAIIGSMFAQQVNAAPFTDDFSTDTKSNYTTSSGEEGQVSIVGEQLKITGNGGAFFMFHNTARLAIGETYRLDFVSGSGDRRLTISTVQNDPRQVAGGYGFRLLLTNDIKLSARTVSNSVESTAATSDVITPTPSTIYISRDTATTYSYGYDDVQVGSGLEITGIDGAADIYVGLELWGGCGDPVYDNLTVETTPAPTLKANGQDATILHGSSDVALTLSGVAHTTFNTPTNPTNGTLTLDPSYATNGQLVYTPNPGVAGVDSFTFTVSDGVTTSDPATVTIEVQGALLQYDYADATDTLGNYGDVSLVANATFSNGVLNIAGDGDYATTPSLGITSTNTITMATWVKPDANTDYTDHTGIIYSRDGTSSGLRVDLNGYLEYDWDGANWSYGQTDCALVKDKWNFVVLVISADKMNFYSATKEQADLVPHERTRAHNLVNLGVVRIGYDNSAARTLVGEFDKTRIWNYSLSATEVEDLFDAEKSSLTPAIGFTLTQTGTEVSWSVEEEIGVEKYEVVDAATGEVLETMVAGEGSYTTTVSEGVKVKVVVVDKSGYTQTFIPADGNVVKVAYDLTEGWNLIAMPGKNADTSEIDSAFWGWNGESYEQVESVEAGKAVWVYSAVAKQVVISAEKVDAELSLETGWNMVGPTANMAIPAEVHTVYGWNDTYQNIATEDGVLIQGVGYWVFCL